MEQMQQHYNVRSYFKYQDHASIFLKIFSFYFVECSIKIYLILNNSHTIGLHIKKTMLKHP
jgi:hypothetical protein